MDIGSNTIRLLVTDGGPGSWEREVLKHSVTRLSGGFDGKLQTGAMDRTVGVVSEFSKIARKLDAWPIRAACTGVTRRADNTIEFLDKIQEIAEFRPIVLSGETEARLTARGALLLTKLDNKPFVILDIGGFSTEIIFVQDKGLVHVSSLGIGVVSLTEKYFPLMLPTSEQVKEVKRIIAVAIRKELRTAQKIGFRAEHLVGTAGTATSLAAMDRGLEKYDSRKVEGHRVAKERLIDLLEKISGLTNKQRLELFPSLEPGREDVILPGILISLVVEEVFYFSEMIVTEGGLLEGLIESKAFPDSTKSH